MRFVEVSLYTVLTATGSLPASAFVAPRQFRLFPAINFVPQQSEQKSFPFHEFRAASTLRVQPEKNESQEQGDDGVNDVAAEAENALKQAELALQRLNLEKNPGAPDQLIDVDQVANADDKETQKIIRKLATGKLAAEDVTTKLIEKQNDIENEKRREVAAEEERKRSAAELEARQKLDALKGEAFAAAVGAAAFGVISGAVLDIYFLLSDIDVESAVPPLVLGVSLGAAAFGVGQKENEIGQVIRNVFGNAASSVSDSVTSTVSNAVEDAVDNVKGVPDYIKNAVDKKVQETTDEIRQIPDRVKGAAIETAEDITDEIKQIPDKVKGAAIETADRTKAEIQIAAKKAVEEVKATPGRVAEGTKQAVVKTVEDVEEKIEKVVEDTVESITGAVDEAVALPGKTLDDITDKVSNIIPSDKERSRPQQTSKAPQMVPKPPEMPPPPSLLKELEKDAVVKSPPKRKVPPQQKQLKPVAKAAPVKKKSKLSKPKLAKAETGDSDISKKAQSSDNEFIFSELSLQKFVGGSNKGKTTEEPKTDLKNAEKSKKKQAIEEKRKEAELASAIKVKKAAEEREMKIADAAKSKKLAEERKAQAIEKKAAIERERLDVQERKAAELRAKRAESTVNKANPGATISLGFFGFGQQKKTESSATGSEAPKGVPTLSNWVQDKDGSVIGSISGSKSFRDGESITTSPITKKNPSDSSLVETTSGSRYYLSNKKRTLSRAGLGSSRSTITPNQTSDNDDKIATVRRIAEEKRAAAAEMRKQKAEERRISAEMKRQEAAEKRRAAVAAKKEAAQKLSSSTGGTISLRPKSQKKLQAKQAEDVIAKAKPGATVSLGFFNFGQSQETPVASSNVSSPRGVPTLSQWRRNRDGSISGRITGSKAFRDGDSITTSPISTKSPSGNSVVTTISGSKYFLDDAASTPVKGGLFGQSPEPKTFQSTQKDVQARKLKLAEEKRAAIAEAAETKRREALEKKAAAEEAAAARKRLSEEKRQASIAAAAERKAAVASAAEARKRLSEEKRQASIAAAAERKATAASAAEAKKRESEEKRQASIAAAAERKATAASAAEARRQLQASKSEEAVAEAKPRSTISLGFLNFGTTEKDSAGSTTTKTISTAPRGVPTISGWRQNRDRSITGSISGSKGYKNGESITTSPITNDAAGNSVVQTSSGSKYFLAPKSSIRSVTTNKMSKPNTRAKKPEEVVNEAKPGATISLGFFNFGSDEQTASNAGSNVTPRTLTKAPRGVPSLSKWRQNRDGSMTGFISDSRAYADGESITTSAITSDAVDGAVVQTTSGSRYYLVPKSTKTVGASSGGIFGTNSKKTPTSQKADTLTSFDARKKKAEEKRAALASAAEARKQQAEEKRAAAAESRKKEAEDKRATAAASAEARKREAAEKRAAAAATMQARKQQAEEKRLASLAAVEERKKIAAEKKAAAAAAAAKQARAKKAQKAVSQAKSRTTISLGFLNFGKKDEDVQSAPTGSGKKPPKIVATSPRGVPTLTRWRQNRDGSITGVILGSKSYADGESITTSPITTDSAFGALVQTTSGSKYFLAPKGFKPPSSPQPQPKKSAARVSPPPKRKTAIPRGVPKLVNWRRNRDLSITGFISGSPNFGEGERITTSAITNGVVESGQVVKTGSGSRYYLV